jgi:alpha-ketoglutaric semialdehyde dehydrogenase
MIELEGKNFIGRRRTSDGNSTFQAFDSSRGHVLDTPLFYEATEAEIDSALKLSEEGFNEYRQRSPDEIALFLENIGDQILAQGDGLIKKAARETGLSEERLSGERGRTINQLRLFSQVVREGSWVEASIDRALPQRKPVPKPDIRRMLIPLGPVVVFGASNFPLAFSVAGGDTASALAAGNPVIVKAHPAHPGTSELVAEAILRAVEMSNMPDGVFSMVQGKSNRISLELVRHPLTKAVAFTGSREAGRALFDAAATRTDPIPVYAEMGSINPVFVLPGILQKKVDALAEGLKQSVTLSSGQFCTCPGLVVGLRSEGMDRLVDRLSTLISQTPPASMLTPRILRKYNNAVHIFRDTPGVITTQSQFEANPSKTEAEAVAFSTDGGTFLKEHELSREVFGPATLIVSCESKKQMEAIAHSLEGHLTATIHGCEDDLLEFKSLISLLEMKVGRLIFNGFPTGVEVCPSMNHGGPYPASTDVKFTPVGTSAIKRFARPICYQDFPQEALPVELRDINRRGILRLIENEWSRSDS